MPKIKKIMINFWLFSCRQAFLQKCLQNGLPEPPRDPPAAPRKHEIDQLFAPGGPQGANNEFLGTPGPPQSPSRRAPGSLWKQSRRPRVAQRPPGSHFGAILPPFWTLRGIIFQGFRLHFALFFLFSWSSFLLRPLLCSSPSLCFRLCALSSVAGSGAPAPVR